MVKVMMVVVVVAAAVTVMTSKRLRAATSVMVKLMTITTTMIMTAMVAVHLLNEPAAEKSLSETVVLRLCYELPDQDRNCCLLVA